MSVKVNKKHKLIPYIDSSVIQKTVMHTASLLNDEYYRYFQHGCPLFLYILEGANRFYSDLIKYIKFPCESIWANHKSYSGSEKTGKNAIELCFSPKILENRDIIIVDDIVDTGHCMSYFINLCEINNCSSVRSCCLLDKRSKRETGYTPDYSGFVIDDVFVVGYGMDYNDKYRDLDYIAELKIDENC